MFGALISGALALGGSILASRRSAQASEFNTRQQVAAQDRTNAVNRDVALEVNKRSYEQNLDFWHRQNAYNTPLAQMQRFREAGLNPHLVYSQSNAAGPIASPAQPVPEYEEKAFQKADRTSLFLDYLQRYQDLKNSQAQEQLIQAQKNYAVQQAESSRVGNRLAVAANSRADAQFGLAKALGDASIRQTNANINFLQTRNALGRNDLDTYDERHPFASWLKDFKERGKKYVDSLKDKNNPPSWLPSKWFDDFFSKGGKK